MKWINGLPHQGYTEPEPFEYPCGDEEEIYKPNNNTMEQREIKFKYIYKRKANGFLYSEIYPLDMFEEAVINPPNPITGMFNNDKGEIIARLRFTGLKDKNGVEIYEGDVVKYKKDFRVRLWNKENWEEAKTNTYKGEVIFNKGSFQVDFIDLRKLPQIYQTGDNINCQWKETSREFEVIGNIYENPDLIKENK